MKKTQSINVKEKVKVAIRVRPYLDKELPDGHDEDAIIKQDQQMLHVQDQQTVN